MRVVCSYCRRVISADPHSRLTEVSHGMCSPCAAHFDRLWAGMSVGEYLDGIARPVILTDGAGRVLAMNQELADLLGVDRTKAVGLLGGEAFACVRSRLPEGCGRTAHCRECAVRRAVETVARTGKACERVRAYVDRDQGRLDLRISARPAKAGVVQVVIDELALAPRTLDA